MRVQVARQPLPRLQLPHHRRHVLQQLPPLRLCRGLLAAQRVARQLVEGVQQQAGRLQPALRLQEAAQLPHQLGQQPLVLLPRGRGLLGQGQL